MAENVPAGNLHITLAEVAKLVGGRCEGPADFVVERLCSAEDPRPDGLAFAEKPQFLKQAAGKVGAILLAEGIDSMGTPAVVCASPRQAFFILLNMAYRPWPIEPGIHPSASIHPTASVDPTASIGAFVSVGEGSTVGEKAHIHAHASIGDDCHVGAESVLGLGAVLVSHVTIGCRTVIHSGAVLGVDGFGFVFDGKRHLKIPQIGTVEVGDDCEIGAFSAIDRAMVGITRLGNGVKLDNHVQIAHNCQIGDHTVVAGHTAIGGSSRIGSRVICGGGVMMTDHTVVADGVRIAGNSRVDRSLLEPGDYFGTPVQPARDGMKNFMLLKRLDDFRSRIKSLEERLAKLEGAQE